MSAASFIRSLCPPLLWEVQRKLRGRTLPPSAEYQGIITPFVMSRLHRSRFAEVHEKWSALDTHIGRDTQKTRLRVYTLCSFASLALANTKSGAFLTAGISFGTAPLIMAEYLDTQGRTFNLVDPLDGLISAGSSEKRGVETAYNTDFDLVAGRWSPSVPVRWIREYLTPESIADVGGLAFVHLNTGDFASEYRCLGPLYDKLVPGGFIVFDIYGWRDAAEQKVVDDLLTTLGAISFEQVTRQLVIFKPS